MPPFESNAAHNLPAEDKQEVSKVRRRRLSIVKPPEQSDELAADEVRPATVEDLPELTHQDMVESHDPSTGITELGPTVYEETEDSDMSRWLKKDLARAPGRFSALQRQGAARRKSMEEEDAEKREREAKTGDARIAGLRRSIARGRALEQEAVTTAAEEPMAGPVHELSEGQFLTRAQAYERITKRFSEIASEHKYLTSLKQNKNTRESLAELDAESKQLSEWMEQVNQTPVGERVPNPFYEADRRAQEAAQVPERVPEKRGSSPEALRNWYDSLKTKYEGLEQRAQALDALEHGVIQDLKQVSEWSSQARETLRQKRADALASVLGEKFSPEEQRIAEGEAYDRVRIRALGYPEMLQTIGDYQEAISDEKQRLIQEFELLMESADRIGNG